MPASVVPAHVRPGTSQARLSRLPGPPARVKSGQRTCHELRRSKRGTDGPPARPGHSRADPRWTSRPAGRSRVWWPDLAGPRGTEGRRGRLDPSAPPSRWSGGPLRRRRPWPFPCSGTCCSPCPGLTRSGTGELLDTVSGSDNLVAGLLTAAILVLTGAWPRTALERALASLRVGLRSPAIRRVHPSRPELRRPTPTAGDRRRQPAPSSRALSCGGSGGARAGLEPVSAEQQR